MRIIYPCLPALFLTLFHLPQVHAGEARCDLDLVQYLAGEPVHEAAPAPPLSDSTTEDLELDRLATMIGSDLLTTGGRQRLRWKFRHPSNDLDAIREIETAVRLLASDDELYGKVREALELVRTYEQQSKPWELRVKAWADSIRAVPRLAHIAKWERFFGPRPLGEGIAKYHTPEALLDWLKRLPFALYPLTAIVMLNLPGPAGQEMIGPTFIALPVIFRNASLQSQLRSGLARLKVISNGSTKLGLLLADSDSSYLRQLAGALSPFFEEGAKAPIRKLSRRLSRMISNPVFGYVYDMTGLGNFTLMRNTSLAHKVVPDLARGASVLAELDTLLKFATWLREDSAFKMPDLLAAESRRVSLTQALNPYLYLDGDEVVANDVDLAKSSDSSSENVSIMFLTGPNARGKSTYARTVGQNLVLAQLGAPVLAEQSSLSPLRIVSSMENSDSIEARTSRFRSELERAKEVFAEIEAHDFKVLVIVDESFIGTSSVQKMASQFALLRSLARRGALAIVTTHDRDLSRLEGQVAGLKNFQVGERGADKFRVFPGVSENYNALELMAEVGLPEDFQADVRQYIAEATAAAADTAHAK